jgi:glycosyltransferase involved in cell wall biosynthesis
MTFSVAHWSLWAPGRSGLFHAVIDQVKYERRVGLDARFIHCDIRDPDPTRFTEEGITALGWASAMDCDIWVLHRSIPNELMSTLPKKKSIAVLHGTSEIMVLHEIESGGRDDKFNMHVDFLNQFNRIVTITESDTQIMKLYENGRNKVVYIGDAIDLEKYTIEGHAWEFKYRPAIISTTNVRVNKNPAPLFWAMPEIIKVIPRARLNIFGLTLADIMTWRNLILKSNAISIAVENIHNQFYDLRPFLRGADISFNSNYSGIFSRDSMEAMACGCSVVAYSNEHTPYACHRQTPSIVSAIKRAWDDLIADPEQQILKNRQYAEEHFDMKKAVDKYIEVYNSL